MPKQKQIASASQPAAVIVTFLFLTMAFGIWMLVKNTPAIIAALDVPQVIQFQGKLTNNNRITVADSALNVKFVIYDASSGGTCLWSAANTDANTSTVDCGTPGAISVTPSDGVISVLLGDTTGGTQNALPDALFDDNATLYLGITVGADAEMTPRIRLGAAPYALQAGDSDLLDSFDTTQTGAASSVLVSSATGALDFVDATTNRTNADAIINVDSETTDTVDRIFRMVTDVGGDESVNFYVTAGGNVNAGDFTCTDCLDFTELADSMTIDANTSISGGSARQLTLTSDISAANRTTTFLNISEPNSASFALSAPLVQIDQADANSVSGVALDINQAGGAAAVQIDETTAGPGIDINSTGGGGWMIDMDDTGANSNGEIFQGHSISTYTASRSVTSQGVLIGRVFTVDDGGAGTANVNVLDDTLRVFFAGTETSGNITHVGHVASFAQTFADASGSVVEITNSGTGALLDLVQADNSQFMRLASTGDEVGVYTGSATPTFSAEGGSLFLKDDSAGTQTPALYVNTSSSDTGTTWSQVQVGSGSSTLQGAYDGGNTITTSDARNLSVTLADTTTDANFIVNLACATCSSSGADGNFIIQDGGTAFWTFKNDSTVSEASTTAGGTALDIVANSLSTGKGLNLSSTATGRTSADLVNLSHTATYTATNTVSGQLLDLSQSLTIGTAGQTLTQSGALATIARTTTRTNGTATLTGGLLTLSNTTSGTVGDSADLVSLTQSDTASTGNTMTIVDSGAHSSGGDVINIDASTTTGLVMDLNADSVNSGKVIDISANGITSGNAINIVSTATLSASSSTSGGLLFITDTQSGGLPNGSLVNLTLDHTAASGTTQQGSMMLLTNKDTGGNVTNWNSSTHMLKLDQQDASGVTAGTSLLNIANAGLADAIIIDQTNTGSGEAMLINNAGTDASLQITPTGNVTGAGSADATGGALMVGNTASSGIAIAAYSNNAAPAQPLVRFFADNTGFTQNVLQVDTDGTGSALQILAAGNTGTTVSTTAGGALSVVNQRGGVFNNDYALTVYSNNTSAQVTPLAYLTAANAGFDQPILQVDQNGVSDGLLATNATTYTTSTTNAGSLVNASRNDVASGAATVLTVSAPVSALSNSFSTVGGGTITETYPASMLFVDQNYTASTTPAVYIDDEQTGGSALQIDASATSGMGIDLNPLALVGGNAIDITTTSGARTSGDYIHVDQTAANTGTVTVSGNLADLNQSLTTTTGGSTLTVSGPLESITRTTVVNSATATGVVSSGLLSLSSTTTSTNSAAGGVTDSGNMVSFSRSTTRTAGGTTSVTGSLLSLSNAVTGTVTDSGVMLDISQANAGSTGDVVHVATAGSGPSLDIDAATTDTTLTGGVNGVVKLTVDASPAAASTNQGFYEDYETIDDANANQIFNGFAIDFLNSSEDAGDATRAVNITNVNNTSGTAVATDVLLRLNNADATAGSLTAAIQVQSSGGANVIIDAIDVSGGNLNNAIDMGGNFALFDGIRMFEGTTGTLTFEDTGGNDLATLVDDGTAGTLTVTNNLAVNGTDMTSTNSTFNIFDAASNPTTIEIGGVTTDLGNTIRIATNNTTADTVFIGNLNTSTSTIVSGGDLLFAGANQIDLNDTASGTRVDIGGVNANNAATVNIATNSTSADTIVAGNTNASTTIALTGGDDWSISATGILTLSASAAQTTAIVATDTDYTNALSVGDNNIIGTTGTLDYDKFDVSAGGIVSVDLNGTATTNGMCHSGADVDTATDTERDLVACNNAAGDYAEWYDTKAGAQPGEILAMTADVLTYQATRTDPMTGLVLSGKTTEHASVLDRATASTQSLVIGVVSTAPGHMIGADVKHQGSHPVPVALTGRVPVRVNMEGGAITVGDPITASSEAGTGMKATGAGQIVGYALESYRGLAGEDGVIMVFVRVGYHASGSVADPAANSSSQLLSASLTTLDLTGDLYMHGSRIVDVGRIEGLGGAWSVDENGLFTTKGSYDTAVASYQGEDVIAHTVLSTEHTVTLSGSGELTDGSAVVNFEDVDPGFNDITSTIAPVRVSVTLRGPANGLYVDTADHNGFTVHETMGGTSNVTFDWFVEAYRKDMEPERYLTVEDPTTDPAPDPNVIDSLTVDPVIEPTDSPTDVPEDTGTGSESTTDPALTDPASVEDTTQPTAPTDPVVSDAPAADSTLEVSADTSNSPNPTSDVIDPSTTTL